MTFCGKSFFAVSIFSALIALCIPHANAQKAVPLTRFDDPADGISLNYPSVWHRITVPEGYCQSMAVGTQSYSRFPIPVKFGIEFTGKGNFYEKTTLESLVFLFGTVKGISTSQCDAITKEFPQEAPDNLNKSGTIGNGHWEYGRGGECGLNHQVEAQVYTRMSGDRCYVIEADFNFMTGPPVGFRSLTDSERKALQRHLDSIVQSVQVRAITLPKSWATTSFHETATGVSFSYPAALKPVRDVTGYFSPALTQVRGLTWRAKLAYRPEIPSVVEEASTDLGEIAFIFATKPTKSSTACHALVQGQGTNQSPTAERTIHGTTFFVREVSDAGLSHFVSGTLYATYRSGFCYLFEEDTVGLDGYAGDVTDAQWKEIRANMEKIVGTIQFPIRNKQQSGRHPVSSNQSKAGESNRSHPLQN